MASTRSIIKQCLDGASSRSAQHLAIRVFLIILVVWIATYIATPHNITQYLYNASYNRDISPSTISWYRALIITIISFAAIIIAISMKGGKLYQDDMVFIAIVFIYSIYWWVQWSHICEAFTTDASMISTGLSNEDWDNMAIGRTWSNDLSMPKHPGSRLVGGLNRPEHYDFAPDDMPLYKLEPDLANMSPSIEMSDEDLANRKIVKGAGNGVMRRFAGLDGPLPSGATKWHTQHVNQQIAIVLDGNSRGFKCKDIHGLPGDFNRHRWNKDRENMLDTSNSNSKSKSKYKITRSDIARYNKVSKCTGTDDLTSDMHNNWLQDYGYTYNNNGKTEMGDEVCKRKLRNGCGIDGLGRGECRHPHYCSNQVPPSKQQIQKIMHGGPEILAWP